MLYPDEGDTGYSYEIHSYGYNDKKKKFLAFVVCLFIVVGLMVYYLFIGKSIIPNTSQKGVNNENAEIVPSILSLSPDGGSMYICNKEGVCMGGIWTHLSDIRDKISDIERGVKNSMLSFTKKNEIDENVEKTINYLVNNTSLFFPNVSYGIYLYKNVTKNKREKNEFLAEFYKHSFTPSDVSLPEFLKGRYFLMAYYFPQNDFIDVEEGDISYIYVPSLIEKIYSVEINDSNWLFFIPISQDKCIVSFDLDNSLFFCEVNGDAAKCILYHKVGVYCPLKYIGSLFYAKSAKGFKEFIDEYFHKFEKSHGDINTIWNYIIKNKIVIYPFFTGEVETSRYNEEGVTISIISLESHKTIGKIEDPSVDIFEIVCVNSLNEKKKAKMKSWEPELISAVNKAGSKEKYCWISMPNDRNYISYNSSVFHCVLVCKDENSVTPTCHNFIKMIKNTFPNELKSYKEKVLYVTKLALVNYVKEIIKKKINPDISKIYDILDLKSKIISKLQSLGVTSFDNFKIPNPAHIKFRYNYSWGSSSGEYYILKDKIIISKTEYGTLAVVKKGSLYVVYSISKPPWEEKEKCTVKTTQIPEEDQTLKRIKEIKFYGVKKGDEYIAVGYLNETLREIEKMCNSSSLKSVCMNYLRKLSEMKLIIKVRNGFVTYEKLILPVWGTKYRYEFFISPTTENEVYQLLASIEQKCKAAQG